MNYKKSLSMMLLLSASVSLYGMEETVGTDGVTDPSSIPQETQTLESQQSSDGDGQTPQITDQENLSQTLLRHFENITESVTKIDNKMKSFKSRIKRYSIVVAAAPALVSAWAAFKKVRNFLPDKNGIILPGLAATVAGFLSGCSSYFLTKKAASSDFVLRKFSRGHEEGYNELCKKHAKRVATVTNLLKNVSDPSDDLITGIDSTRSTCPLLDRAINGDSDLKKKFAMIEAPSMG